MNVIQNMIKEISQQHGIQLMYAFGSRAQEALRLFEGKQASLSVSIADLDIGIKSKRLFFIDEKIAIAQALEDAFRMPRVDLVILNDAPVFLGLEVVRGELLYAEDTNFEAEYQLYIMRMAGELIPYEHLRQKMILGI